MGSLKWTLTQTIADTSGVQIADAVHVDSGKVTTSATAASIGTAPTNLQGRNLQWALNAEGNGMWARFDGADAVSGKGHYIAPGSGLYLKARAGQSGSVIDD